MANECRNRIEITGEPGRVQEVLSSVMVTNDNGTYFNLRAIVPEPPEDQQLPDWYCWRVANWGTKWAWLDCESGPEIGATGANLVCWSAWTPPIAALVSLSEQYPGLAINMDSSESNCDLYIHAEIAAGKVRLVDRLSGEDIAWRRRSPDEVAAVIDYPDQPYVPDVR